MEERERAVSHDPSAGDGYLPRTEVHALRHFAAFAPDHPLRRSLRELLRGDAPPRERTVAMVGLDAEFQVLRNRARGRAPAGRVA